MKPFRCILLAAAMLAWNLHAADLPSSTEELIGFDKRREHRATPSQQQRQAHDSLRQKLGGARVDFDTQLGSPKWIRAERETLTEGQGAGKAVAAQTAARFAKDEHKAVKAFVEEHRGLFGHGPEALDTAAKTRDYVGEANGVRTTVWQQRIEDIPVYESIFAAHVSKRGELMDVSSQFVPEPDRAAERGTPNRAAHLKSPKQSVRKAIEAAAKAIGEPADEIVSLTPKPQGAEQVQSFQVKPLPGEAIARLVWFALDRDTLRLAWHIELNRRQFSERFRVLIDVQNGEVLLRRKLTVDIGAVTYRVFTNDSPTPMRPGWPTPNATQPPIVSQSLVTLSALSTNASPLGWINDGDSVLRGNNVDGRLDRDADDRADLPRVTATVDANGNRTFDLLADAAQQPTNYSAAAAVQLFYWCNWMHDRLYDIGFTEAKGNFQKDNFGRGGVGNDAIIADAQDGSGVNNANFTPSGDGQPARIQMYVFTGPNPQHDGALDAEVILHEYTHGMSDRRVGHGVGISQLQTWGMAEGWSDFFAEAMLTGFEHALDGNYPMGGYASYLFNNVAESYYFGIRRYPYSTDTNVNPLVFKDIDPPQAGTYTSIPRNPSANGPANEVHRIGEVWCAVLWELRAALLKNWNVTAETYPAANDLVMKIVAEGMDQCPPNPSLVQAREAIFAAERSMPETRGTNAEVMWAAFAKRGLGVGAAGFDSSTTAGIVASFLVPQTPPFVVTPPVLTFSGVVGGPFISSGTNSFILSNQTSLALPWAVAASPLTLNPSSGTLPPRGAIYVTVLTNGMELLPVGQTDFTVVFTNVTKAASTNATVSVSVKPPSDALLVTVTGSSTITGEVGGPFTPDTIEYSLESAVPVVWAISNAPTWLTFSPTGGTLQAGQPTIVHATVNSAASALAKGVYTRDIFFRNKTSGTNVTSSVTLRVGTEDWLAEDFNGRAFDLHNKMLTLTPSGDRYAACLEPAVAFAVPPTNATALANLADDEYRLITLSAGRTVSFFGLRTNAFWIGGNGNISTDPGDTSVFHTGIDAFFTSVRIAPLYVDLDPSVAGQVSWEELSDRVVITWADLPEFGKFNLNNFQLEMFYDGTARITWLRVDATGNIGFNSIVGVSAGLGKPTGWVTSDLSALGGCAPVGRLVIPSLAREGDGTLQGAILLSMPNTNGPMDVVLTTDTTNEVSVPHVVTIPTGILSATFPITIVDDQAIDGTQVTTVTATFTDRPSASASIVVDDNESTRITIAVPAEGTEGEALTDGGYILLGATAGKDVTVQLYSSNANRISVPSSVVVPAGSRTAFFDVSVVDDSLINGPVENVFVAASVVGWPYDRDVIAVHDNEPYELSLAFIPSLPERAPNAPSGSVSGYADVGTVSVPVNVAVPIAVQLTSANPGVAFPPPTAVTIPVGTNAVTFPVWVRDNDNTNAFDQLEFVATSPGFLSATSSLVILDDERPTPPFGPIPANGATHVRRDTALAWSMNPAPVPGTMLYDVYLDTTPNPTTRVATVTSTILGASALLDAGRTYYWKVVSRREPFSASSEVWSFTTANLERFTISTNVASQFVGEPFNITVTARDEHNLVVNNYAGQALISGLAPAKLRNRILITEVETESDRVEFQNVSDQGVNIGGWQVVFYDAASWPAPKATFVIPPATANPGELFRVRAFNPRFAPGTYPNFNMGTTVTWNSSVSNNPVAVLLRDGASNVVDFFCAVDAFANQITEPALISTNEWSGPPVAANPISTNTYQRFGNVDRNIAADWNVLPASILTNNVGMVLPFTSYAPVTLTNQPFVNFVGGVCTAAVTVLDEARQVFLIAGDGAGHSGTSSRFDVLARNDISVRATAPDALTLNDPFTVSLLVSNSGPTSATGILLTNVLSSAEEFVSASSSVGSCSLVGGTVVCSLGNLIGASSALVTLNLRAIATVAITNLAVVARADADNYLPNNTASTVTVPSQSLLSISETNATEGGAVVFNVRLTPRNSGVVTVRFATTNGSATAGLDYIATNGILVFPPGSTNQTITVPTLQDSLIEPDETFTVGLSSATNALLITDIATGTIRDDEFNPVLTINDVVVNEGANGTNTVVLAATLSKPSGKQVAFRYSTVDGSAMAGLDYVPTYGTIFMPPGTTNASIELGILASDSYRPTRSFFVDLFLPSEVVFARSRITCTIVDKDTNRVHHLAFESAPQKAYVDVPFPIGGSARDVNGGLVTNFAGAVHLLAAESEATLTIGSNAVPFEFPLGGGFHDSRAQVIYLASEISPAGDAREITSLSLDVTNAPGITLSNFTIRTKAIGASQFAVPTWESGGWMTNFQADVTILSTGWVTFAFRQPYVFDGLTNVLIDFSFNNNLYGSEGLCRGTAVGAMRSMGFRTDSAFGDPLTWSNVSPPAVAFNRIPNTRFTLGRPIAATPPITIATNGLFVSLLKLGASGSNATLRIVDDAGHYAVYSGFQVVLDGDGDGLPDWWEISAGLDRFSPLDGLLDSDGDGFSNLQEFYAATDPHNAASSGVFSIAGIASSEGGVAIKVKSASGRHYQLESSAALGSTWTALGRPIAGTGGEILFLDPNPSAAPLKFYRVRVSPQ